MAYDPGLAQRIRELLQARDVVETPGLADDADLQRWIDGCAAFVVRRLDS